MKENKIRLLKDKTFNNWEKLLFKNHVLHKLVLLLCEEETKKSKASTR
jgi:hypothetical protein